MEVASDRVFALDPEPDYRRVRPLQFLAFLFMGLLAVWLAILMLRAIEHSVPGGLDGIVVGGIVLPLGMVVAIWGALGLGRGADSCRVTADGFTLAFRGGRTTTFTWNDPKLRLTLFELLSRGRTTYMIATRRPFLNPIPQDLYLAILSEARVRGLSVSEHIDTLPSGHQLKIRVRAAMRSSQS